VHDKKVFDFDISFLELRRFWLMLTLGSASLLGAKVRRQLVGVDIAEIAEVIGALNVSWRAVR
jgi:hypothetical protein